MCTTPSEHESCTTQAKAGSRGLAAADREGGMVGCVSYWEHMRDLMQYAGLRDEVTLGRVALGFGLVLSSCLGRAM